MQRAAALATRLALGLRKEGFEHTLAHTADSVIIMALCTPLHYLHAKLASYAT